MQTIKDLLSRVTLFARLETAICAELEKHDSRLKALEEHRKLKDKTILSLQKEVQELRLLVQRSAPSNGGVSCGTIDF